MPGHRRRRLHGAEQGVVRQPLRLLLLRPEDDGQDQVLRGRPQARMQEMLRQVSKLKWITIKMKVFSYLIQLNRSMTYEIQKAQARLSESRFLATKGDFTQPSVIVYK